MEGKKKKKKKESDERKKSEGEKKERELDQLATIKNVFSHPRA